MRVLVLGAGGMLASDLMAAAPAHVELIALGRAQADVTVPSTIAGALDAHRPELVVNGAAYTLVDRAEVEHERAEAVNGSAPGRLGQLCASRGVAVVHFSTDYVFAGDAARPYEEHDPTAPANAYGRSKKMGEEALLDSGARALILRTQWLYGPRGKSFPQTMWARARAGVATRVVSDQVGRPTFTVDLSAAVWQLILAGASGTYHVANEGHATWFDVASAIFEAAGVPELLTPCRTEDFPTAARRPSFSALSTAKLARDHGIVLPHWRDALNRFLIARTS